MFKRISRQNENTAGIELTPNRAPDAGQAAPTRRHRSSASRLGIIICLLMWTGVESAAQSPAALDEKLDAAERQAVVEDIGRHLNELYIFPDIAKRSGDRILQQLNDGEFDDITDPKLFATRLTESLYSVSNDKHMYVRVLAPEILEEETEPYPENGPSRTKRQGRITNHGFKRLEILDGNVGYLELRRFFSSRYVTDTAYAAMALLANSDAIIVDLRNNPGGSAATVALLCSYFFEGQVHINTTYGRGEEKNDELWTLKHVPGRRMPDTPLYILTGPKTGSAAEAFAYHLQAMGRATVVGARSAGGGMRGSQHRVDERFRMQVSRWTVINTVSGKGFEGVGVIPDIPADPDRALEVALAEAQTVAEQRRELMAEQARVIRGKVGPIIEKADQLHEAEKYAEAALVYEEALLIDPDNAVLWDTLGACYYESSDKSLYDRGIVAYRRAAGFPETRQMALLNMACLHALSDRPEAAIDALEECVRAGFPYLDYLGRDSDLASLREMPRFQALIER